MKTRTARIALTEIRALFSCDLTRMAELDGIFGRVLQKSRYNSKGPSYSKKLQQLDRVVDPWDTLALLL